MDKVCFRPCGNFHWKPVINQIYNVYASAYFGFMELKKMRVIYEFVK